MNYQRVMFLATAVAFSSSCISVSDSVAGSPQSAGKGIVVKVVTRPPIETGIIPAWVRVEGLSANRRPLELFIPYMTTTQKLPEVGANCSFSWHFGDVEGVVGVRDFKGKNLRIVDHFDCH